MHANSELVSLFRIFRDFTSATSLTLSTLYTRFIFPTLIMLSIKNSLCSALLLATYATAAKPGQSAINLSVEYCSDENTGADNDKGVYSPFVIKQLIRTNTHHQAPTSTKPSASATIHARANSNTLSCSTKNAGARTRSRLRQSTLRSATNLAPATRSRSVATKVPACTPTSLLTALPSVMSHLRSVNLSRSLERAVNCLT